jgi:hypothetical protein
MLKNSALNQFFDRFAGEVNVVFSLLCSAQV